MTKIEHSKKEQREEWYQNLVTTDEFRTKVKESQRIAGEILWLTTRTRPDLCFSIQKMSSLATKNQAKAVQYGLRMLRYLKATEDFGLKYLTKEETIKKHGGVSEDWPNEVFEEQRAVVWTDSSFASQEDQKSQGAIVLTHCMAPVYWKCARQALIAMSTAESELQMLCEGSLATRNVGILIKETMKPMKESSETEETIKEL